MACEEEPSKSIMCLRTNDYYSLPYSDPVAVWILDFFLQLLVCKSARVKGLKKLENDVLATDDTRQVPSRMCFDASYFISICWALESWLQGVRDGFTLAQGRDRYGRPPLEQLAYIKISDRTHYSDYPDW